MFLAKTVQKLFNDLNDIFINLNLYVVGVLNKNNLFNNIIITFIKHVKYFFLKQKN